MRLEYLYEFLHVVTATLSAAFKQCIGMVKVRKESPQEG